MCLFRLVLHLAGLIIAMLIPIAQHLVTLPLGRSNRHGLVDGDLRQLGRKLGKETLVGSKASSKLGEGVHLAGETESVARHIHKLARGTRLLTHGEDTLLLHGLSKATEEVLAETHTPAHAHLSEDLHVLVDETIHLAELLDDRDDASTEGWVQLRGASTLACLYRPPASGLGHRQGVGELPVGVELL